MIDHATAGPMRATEIEVSDLHFFPDRNLHEGYVSMRISRGDKATQVHFQCRTDQPSDAPAEIVMQRLIEDALRQAHRMPGFRRGEQRIEVEISQAQIAPRTAPV